MLNDPSLFAVDALSSARQQDYFTNGREALASSQLPT